MKTNEETSRAFAFLASLLSVLAFALYNLKSSAGNTNPNISSWSVWASITILNFTSYKKLAGNWTKSVLPTANSVMCILTALLAIHTGSFRSLSGINQVCLILGVVAGIGWWVSRSASYAQLILQVAIVVGFIPTLTGVWNKPSSEPAMAWLLWMGAFVSQCLAVKCNWGGKKMEYLYPVNMLIFHSAVFVLALR